MAVSPLDVINRRRFIAGLAAAGLLTGCAAPRPQPATPGTGPIVIEHKFGTIELSAPPTRVVTVGLSEQDAMLALGVAPVGVRDWYGEQPSAVWPWARDALGDASPEVLPAEEIAFEQIAALEPDLIVATYSGITAEEYSTLTAIAPTLAQSGDVADYAMSWQDQTLSIGQALGRADRAEELVAGVEARFAAVRERHPEFAGRTAVLAQEGEPGQYDVLSSTSPRGSILTALGFTTPPEITDLIEAGGEEFVAVSGEQLDLLDAGVLVWQVGLDSDAFVAALRANPLYQRLTAVREGRDVFVADEIVAGALTWSTVLSIPYVIDALEPVLVAAVDGDPATTA